MRALIASMAVVVPLLASAAPLVIQTRASCPNGVTLTAEVDPEARDFHVWEDFGLSQTGVQHFGVLHARNTSSKFVATLSTSEVMLSIDGHDVSRSYSKDIIGTPIIDIGGRDLCPGESIDVEVYWPDAGKSTGIGKTAALSCTAVRTKMPDKDG